MTGVGGVGLVGLGVMGRNLVLNIAEKGFPVVGLDSAASAVEAARGQGLQAFEAPEPFIRAIARPRLVILMTPAGAAVDAALAQLLPLLERGDVVADCGNSFWRDSARRSREAETLGVYYLGVGVSGGEAGARHGPSVMGGGSEAAWALASPVFEAIAARANGRPCCARFGPAGAGHFVKMVHNGIEYALMQLIAESYAAMRGLMGLDARGAGALFEQWRHGDLGSFLIDISVRVLTERDPETGEALVDQILDKAEQKGTGAWASIAAIEMGVPVPTLIEAAQARSLSALKDLRVRLAAAVGAGSSAPSVLDSSTLEAALKAGSIAAFAQGFSLLAEASRLEGWGMDLGAVARVWQAGCIIRARLLEPIAEALDGAGGEGVLLAAPSIARLVEHAEPGMRRFVAAATMTATAAPAHASALAWLDGMRTARLPADLVQALRDFFGAHRFQRIDRPGSFHHDWSGR